MIVAVVAICLTKLRFIDCKINQGLINSLNAGLALACKVFFEKKYCIFTIK